MGGERRRRLWGRWDGDGGDDGVGFFGVWRWEGLWLCIDMYCLNGYMVMCKDETESQYIVLSCLQLELCFLVYDIQASIL